MIALKVINIKEFMNLFLRTELFDHFLMSEGSISTYMTYLLDGHINREFFDSQEESYSQIEAEEYLPFSMVRNTCFDLIKGKRTPISFKFVFLLSKENQNRTLSSLKSSFSSENISGMYLNLKYKENQVIFTTGISYRMFSLDKSLEHSWDDMMILFLKKHGIACEVLS
ncbi:MAG: DUF5721 family protein [Lachnospiraceae bacterium]